MFERIKGYLRSIHKIGIDSPWHPSNVGSSASMALFQISSHGGREERSGLSQEYLVRNSVYMLAG